MKNGCEVLDGQADGNPIASLVPRLPSQDSSIAKPRLTVARTLKVCGGGVPSAAKPPIQPSQQAGNDKPRKRPNAVM